ncbi:DNA polymerase delta subunit 4 [Vanrija pseudolonga]|uniref:DNA polymerase delta subunit 4 n=1 Tax=Vanrija pseudolonga TaxID=143232 RepID=A0AAF1BP66_9TREE|nr:DNA polymerase delta subunit 4 [Vanrija pseudolonga]
MPPRRSAKQSTGLSQASSRPESPTLSFQTRRPTTGGAKAVAKSLNNAPSVRKVGSVSSLSSVERASTPKDEEKPQEVIKVADDVREALDPNGKEWNKLYDEAKRAMDTAKPIHSGPETTKVHHILRVFDMTSKYGPCVGMTRLERWERAKKWGLNPPEEVKAILLTQQGEDDTSYRQSVLYGWV